MEFKGGVFEGAPGKNYPGIDGWLDGTPVQLKEVKGNGMNAVQRSIVGGAKDMSKTSYTGDLYIDAVKTGVDSSSLLSWAKPNTPILNILNEGVVKNIYVKTTSGWVNITKSTITKNPK